MPNAETPQGLNALEEALNQLETVTLRLMALLNESIQHPQLEFHAALAQHMLLRGELLQTATGLANEQATILMPEQTQVFSKKLLQLNRLHQEMGVLLNQQHERTRQALADTYHNQDGMKAYHKAQDDTPELHGYFEDA
jgi:hypothetical protein